MPARVVLHAQVLDPFLLAIKSTLGKRGVTVVHEDGFDPTDLHFVTESGLTAPNIVEVRPLLVAPYRALVHPTLHQTFKPDAVPYGPAKRTLDDLRADHANGKRHAVADLPDGMLAVCIGAGDYGPTNIAIMCQMITDALTVRRPVVLVSEDPIDSGRLAQFSEEFPSVIVYHDMLADLLHKTVAVISRAGAGVLLAHMHRKPAVLYAPAPFDHICPIVSTDLPFQTALTQALGTDGVYAKYLHWYFQTQAMRADAPDFGNRLMSVCEALGFGPALFGLEAGSSFARSLMDTHDAAQSLTQFLEGQPDITDAKLLKKLKVSDRSWVFKAQINGDTVVVKRFIEADPAHTVRSLQGELAFMDTALRDSPFGVNRCIFAWPDAGTVALSYVRGDRMVNVIKAQSGPKRAALLTKAGAWLNAYATPRHRETSFGPRHWVKELDARPRHKLEPDALAAFEAGFTRLSQLAQVTMGCGVVQAAVHGDYAGINVLIDKDQVTGVDIQGECWQALARDASHFLVWQALHDPRDTGVRVFGIDGADFDAYFAGLPMLRGEHTTTVPFFIGWKIMHHLLDKADLNADATAVLRLLQAYISDLDEHLEKLG